MVLDCCWWDSGKGLHSFILKVTAQKMGAPKTAKREEEKQVLPYGSKETCRELPLVRMEWNGMFGFEPNPPA